MLESFKPSELLSSYPEFKKISENRKKTLNKETKKWLKEWELWDLACSPMDDNERKLIRYGHYLGWFAHYQ